MWTLGQTVLKILGKDPGATSLFDVSYPNDLIFKSSQNLRLHWFLFAPSLMAANFYVLPFPPPLLLQHYPSQTEHTGPERDFFFCEKPN